MNFFENVKHLLFYPKGKSSGFCCLCGKWLWAECSVCQDCIGQDLEPLAVPLVWPHPLNRNVTCRAIFDWTPIRYPRLSAALVAGKGEGSRLTWRGHADLFLNQHSADLWRNNCLIKKIIPVPASDPSRQHANHLAMGLAEILSIELGHPDWSRGNVMPLNQRGKSRRERLRVGPNARAGRIQEDPRFARLNNAEAESGDGRAITVLVDDILTTGATTARYLDEIHDPAPIEVWVLARRGVVAPPDGFC